MFRENFNSASDFIAFVKTNKEIFNDAETPEGVDAFEILEQDFYPDSYPCIMVWDIEEVEDFDSLEVVHEYIYPSDFMEEDDLK